MKQELDGEIQSVARPSPALHVSFASHQDKECLMACHKAHPSWGVLQEVKLEKERLERERKLKQKQKAKDRVRSEKEKLAAEKEAAEREARERSEEQLRLQEQQSLAARSATTFACQFSNITFISLASCGDASSPCRFSVPSFSTVPHCKQ